LRIGIDYTAAVHQRAGIGRYTRGIVSALAGQSTEDTFVLVVAGDGAEDVPPQQRSRAQALGPNFRVRQLPLSRRFWTIVWQRLRVPLPVDVLVGAMDVFHSPDYVLPPVRRGRKLVTIHDLSFLRNPEGAEPSLRRYLSEVVPRSARRADLILADSESTRQDVVELLGVAPEGVDVVYPGVDRPFGPIEDREVLEGVKELYGLRYPFVLTVGTLEPRKNLAVLLEAYALLRERHSPPHKLVIAGGKGWLYEGIFRCVEELSLTEEVVFLGYVPEEHLPALYNLADVLAFPSVYEGFGLPPLEAMACGTPVVTSDRSSLPEVVGEAGLMVPADDHEALAEAIGRVLDDAALREDLVRRGLSRAAMFSWEATGQKLLSVYGRWHERATG
jgi:glycosyltransferase involved in cell wall biosynthesis